MKKNNKIKRLIWIDVIILMILLFIPFNRLFGTSNYVIIQLIYVIYTLSVLYLLFLILKNKRELNQWIYNNFKIIFLALSVITVTVTGIIYLGLLNLFVIPKSMGCIYYDTYNYKLYSSKRCEKLIIEEERYNEFNDLIYLSYQIDGHTYKRFYQNNQIIKTIEESHEPIQINYVSEEVTFIYDRQIIETTYQYEENLFTQDRTLTIIANGKEIAKQYFKYSTTRDPNKHPQFNSEHEIKMHKEISNYELLVSIDELNNYVYTHNYMKQLNNKVSQEEYVNAIYNYLTTSREKIVNKNFYEKKRSTEYSVTGHIGISFNYDYVDESINAWHERDSFIQYLVKDQNPNNDYFYNQYYKDKVLIRDDYKRELYINCHETNNVIDYCDRTLGLKHLLVRYIITHSESVKKVEAFNMIENKLGFDHEYDSYIYSFESIEYEFLPFDYDLSLHEIFEVPKPFVKFH